MSKQFNPLVKYGFDEVGDSTSSILNNFTATTNPAVTDDTGDGYSVGSIWINLTTDIAYQCTDASTGAAVWREIISANASQTISNKTFVGGTFNGQTLNNPRLQAVDEFYIDNNVTIKGRNQADNANIDIVKVNTSNQVELANNLNLSTYTVGDATAADLTKLHALTADSTELNYVDGVTSAIQTQLNAKAPLASPSFTGTVTLPTGLTGVLRADSGVVSTDSDITDLVSASSDTVAGKVELATIAETTTGTDTGRAVTPDGLAGSAIFGRKTVQIYVVEATTDLATGDGKAYFVIPESLNGMNLVRVHARVITAGTTGTTDIQIANVTDSVDMLSTKITIDSTETGSDTGATPAVIDTTKDDVATNDLLRIDVDALSTTKPKGLIVTMEFQLP